MRAATFLADRSFGHATTKDPMTNLQPIPTISPATIALYSFFDGAIRFDADATIDGVRNPEAGEALTSWAAMRGFSAVVSIVTPTIGSNDMRPYEVVRVQIGTARISVLCSRFV